MLPQASTPCPMRGCRDHDHRPPKRKPRNYNTGFRDGIKFAAVVQVLTFTAVGLGYAVAVALGIC